LTRTAAVPSPPNALGAGAGAVKPALVAESASGVGNFAAKGPVVIGENMARVKAYAGAIGGQTIDDWLAGRQWSQKLNDDFIATTKAQGQNVVDIGPDFDRRLQNRIDPSLGRPSSDAYGSERRELLDYEKYVRTYERIGKYEADVPRQGN